MIQTQFLMTRFSSVCFVFFLLACNAQNETAKPKPLIEQVTGFYNLQQYDSIFFLFSGDMKASLPLEKTKDFFSQLKTHAGSIEKHEFIITKNAIAEYKTNFSKAVLLVQISESKNGKIAGLRITPYEDDRVSSMPRNITKMSLPFSGEWFVFWGGDTEAQNYHVVNKAQKNAFDIIIKEENGNSYKTDGKANEDYYAFGQPLIAPCDAEVVLVTDGVKDNVPGEMNPAQVTGNTVVLKTAANEYLLLAHFKLNSIKVKTGESVKKGQLLGLCGNSGNSSEPHLHFHIQDKENMIGSSGVKCYFDKIKVNGEIKKDYSPVKGERIKNAD